MAKQIKTSWENSAKWYDAAVGEKGHYYHERVIFPGLLKAMDLKKGDRLLDLGCGQGILSRQIPKGVSYVGIDLSKSLISQAEARAKNSDHHFLVKDATKPFSLKEKGFTHATMILSLQNMENPKGALKNVALHLAKGGRLFLVLNHPCFRIPRQTHWGFDDEKKVQYRRIDSYLSEQKIPIQTHPGKKDKEETWSFHSPLSTIFGLLGEAGFSVSGLEEWVSDKKSTGGRAGMENRARKEIPLFMLLTCQL